MTRRDDIDGLRGLAVFMVILTHAFPNIAPNGHVGVDIFFVISGFVIMMLIKHQGESGNFHYPDFLQKRAARILPAMTLIILVIATFSYILLIPQERSEVGKVIFGTSLLSPNLVLMGVKSYFHADSHYNPALHLWSLGVELQFYLLAGAILWMVYKIHKILALPSLIVITLASLFYGLIDGPDNPTTHFYGPLSRAWEFGFGMMLAFVPPRFYKYFSCISWIALGALIFMAFSGGQRFGTTALFPVVIATCLVLLGSQSPRGVGLILKTKPFVFAGLISYSLYLWHQPLLVGARIFSPNQSPVFLISAIFIAIPLAWITWVYIEKPGRRVTFLPQTAKVFILIAISTTFMFVGGKLYMYDPDTNMLAKEEQESKEIFRDCYLNPDFDLELTFREKCFTGMKSPDIVMMGDSHTASLIPSLLAYANDNKISASAVSRGACAMIDNVYNARPLFEQELCHDHNTHFMSWLVKNKPNTVVLPAFGQYYSLPLTGKNKVEHNISGLVKSVSNLQKAGINVIVVMPWDHPSWRPARMRARHQWRGTPLPSTFSQNYKEARALITASLAHLEGIKNAGHISLLDPSQVFCQKDECQAFTPDDAPLFYDNNHLSFSAARWLFDSLIKQGLDANLLNTQKDPSL